jgi:hypothetical protein
MGQRDSNQFVADGYERACEAAIDKIRAAVAIEYAERLQAAGWWERWLLRYAMRREVERRLQRIAPPWGLYLTD